MIRFLKKLALLNLYMIYCFDIAAIVIVFLIFTPLVIQTDSPLISPALSSAKRNLILGFLFAAYPASQFFGAPILGDLSDHFGRKKILIISTFATAFCFFLTAMSILLHHLVWLFISRFVGGFFAGNASLAQATVSDLLPAKKKSSGMALFTIVGGLSWILGPFLGGVLSNPKILPWFNYSVPFWFLGLLFLLCTALLLATLETQSKNAEKTKLSIIGSIKNLVSIFHVRIIVIPFATASIAMFAWMIIQSFSAPYLMEHFKYSFHAINYVYAYYSFFWLLGGLFSLFWFKKHPPSKLNFYCLFLISAFLFIFSFSKSFYGVFWWMPSPNILMAISMSAYMSLFSHLVNPNMQGKIFGAYTGAIALASALAPPFAGWLSTYSLPLPFLIASIIFFILAGIYVTWLCREKHHLNHNKL